MRLEENLPVAGDDLFEGVPVEMEEFIRYVQLTGMPHPLNRMREVEGWKDEEDRIEKEYEVEVVAEEEGEEKEREEVKVDKEWEEEV